MTKNIEAAAPQEGPPTEAFARLVRTSWPMLSRFGSLHVAALRVLSADEVRRHHHEPMAHVERLVLRGRDQGAFRTDLPVEWLVTAVFSMLHAATDEAAAGRMAGENVGEILVKTLLAILRPDGA
ncbi:hypothetical protein [Actinomadura sp. 9N407]|uniref:hypothetical protein n=1 Tax=Actinomadura sp. 9N407 TaxID=3375154 RepID=UPI0037966F40